MTVYCYARVSTGGQRDSGLGLDAQRERMLAECEQREWVPVVVEEAESGGTMNRPELQRILSLIKKGDVLMCAKLDRLSRSVLDFAELMERANKEGWALVLLEPSVDTTTPHGKFTANIFAAVAELERDMISQRTKEALAALKRRGVRLGAPRQIPETVERRILMERDAGFSLRAIARGLDLDGVPTATGARWAHSTVARVLARSGRQ